MKTVARIPDSQTLATYLESHPGTPSQNDWRNWLVETLPALPAPHDGQDAYDRISAAEYASRALNADKAGYLASWDELRAGDWVDVTEYVTQAHFEDAQWKSAARDYMIITGVQDPDVNGNVLLTLTGMDGIVVSLTLAEGSLIPVRGIAFDPDGATLAPSAAEFLLARLGITIDRALACGSAFYVHTDDALDR